MGRAMRQLTLRNHAAYIAQLVAFNGGQMVTRIPGVAPVAQVPPTTSAYQVRASAVIVGNTHTSAPIDVTGATGSLA